MKIGVLSDTHNRDLPNQMLEDFAGVDLIVHAGDSCSIEDINSLGEIAEIVAVSGNMDERDVRDRLKDKVIFEKEGLRIGVFHGRGPSKRVLDFVIEEFKDDKVDVIIFGHSHIPFNEAIDGILYFNPGSPNDKFCSPICSYGMMEIEDGKASGKIIEVKCNG